jgi:hypothetical protein
MTDEELRRRLDAMQDTQAKMAKSISAVEKRVTWLFTAQPGESASPIEDFVATTREWKQAKFVARLSRYGLAAAFAASAALMGWWRDILDFARVANGGK